MSKRQDTSDDYDSSPTNPFAENDEEPMEEGDTDEDEEEVPGKPDEQLPHSMTESYSEITLLRKFCENPHADEDQGAVGGQKRPDSFASDDWMKQMEGTFIQDGNLTSFIADNLEAKIKMASPSAKKDFLASVSASKSNTPCYLPKNFLLPSHLTQVDSNVLNDIELEAQYLAASVDNLTENLCNLLHSISSITADNVDCYKNAVNKLTDSMDANIKHMYTIMAKTEEISKTMKPAEQLAGRIRDLKKLVDMFESNL